jgi:prepilin-type N-terminal cleavage/methylation domain-containing protein
MLRRQPGFTLVELMVAVAITAIVAVVGTPAYGALIEALRVSSAVSDLHQAVLYARSEAAKRGRNVVVESKDGNRWGSGWRVREGAELLRDGAALPGGITVTGTGTSLAFAPHGRPSSAITLTVCPAPGSSVRGRQVTVSTLGRAVVAEAGC